MSNNNLVSIKDSNDKLFTLNKQYIVKIEPADKGGTLIYYDPSVLIGSQVYHLRSQYSEVLHLFGVSPETVD